MTQDTNAETWRKVVRFDTQQYEIEGSKGKLICTFPERWACSKEADLIIADHEAVPVMLADLKALRAVLSEIDEVGHDDYTRLHEVFGPGDCAVCKARDLLTRTAHYEGGKPPLGSAGYKLAHRFSDADRRRISFTRLRTALPNGAKDAIRMETRMTNADKRSPTEEWEISREQQVQCESCAGQGWHQRAVTREMALDAGQPQMEGTAVQEQCATCHGDGWYLQPTPDTGASSSGERCYRCGTLSPCSRHEMPRQPTPDTGASSSGEWEGVLEDHIGALEAELKRLRPLAALYKTALERISENGHEEAYPDDETQCAVCIARLALHPSDAAELLATKQEQSEMHESLCEWQDDYEAELGKRQAAEAELERLRPLAALADYLSARPYEFVKDALKSYALHPSDAGEGKG